jgi:hypothetical protein
MGHASESTIVYVGQARLPQPLVAAAPSVAVELEVDLCSRRVVGASTNLQFPGLDRLLQEILVGRPIDAGDRSAVLELEVRYSAPFTTAVGVAVQSALRRAVDGAARGEDRPSNGRRAPMSLHTLPAGDQRESAARVLSAHSGT